MAVLATLDEPSTVVSTIEIEAPDEPYSFQTIERLKRLYGPESSLFFIMGADSFEEIHTWREPKRLLAGANIIVVTRPGYEVRSSLLPAGLTSSIIDMRGRSGGGSRLEEKAEDGTGACRVYLTDYVNNDVSSTEIRQRVHDGKTISGLVPPGVASYIEKYELYRR